MRSEKPFKFFTNDYKGTFADWPAGITISAQEKYKDSQRLG